MTTAGRLRVRPARPDDLARLGPLYEQAGFSPYLARVVAFASERLDGPVVVAEAAGELVGVAAGALFDGTGWVGGVAVDPAHRRAGLGGALTGEVIEFLEERGAATVLLQATELGRSVYERLGFVADSEFVTLAGTGPPDPDPGPAGGPRPTRIPVPRPGRADDLEAVSALDRVVTGEDRRPLVAALWPAGGLVVAAAGEVLGFHLGSPWRPGGATVARDPATGLALLAAAAAGDGTEVPISVPVVNVAAVRALRAAGFQERYRTTRMHRGPRVPWEPAAMFGAHTLFWG